MNKMMLFVIGVLAFNGIAIASDCRTHFTQDQLFNLKDNSFLIESDVTRNKTALNLLHCLANPNPKVRDGIVYEAIAHWLRNGQLATSTIKQLYNRLQTILSSPQLDKNNFQQPFAALILSEVVRVDRITPYLSDQERQQTIKTIIQFMNSIEDYRGFNNESGWRHSVAHSADVILQLALNKAINKNQLNQMVVAIKEQVHPKKSHFYVYGEPKRLATAFVYIVLREELSDNDLKAFFTETSNPTPFESWGHVYQNNAGLAKLHNTRSFYYSLLAIAGFSEHPQLQKIQPLIKDAIKRLG